MAQFVQEYAALRWSVVAAFLVAAAMVVMRVTASPGAYVGGRSGAPPPVWDPADNTDGLGRHNLPVHRAIGVAHHESDAAHLIMCLVMLTMLIFPLGADPHALHGVLTAVTVVFAVLLVSRIPQWRSDGPGLATHRILALAYHVIAAAAMLYAMSGHSGSGHPGPAPIPVLVLAALFCADAVAVLVAYGTGRSHFGHPLGAGDTALPSAAVPHLVMDLGTAYMLVAVVQG
ncbi:DUF5134 domain-containing protein [Nocardia sp. NPDC005366]|uniref:DUF5134 domain-containing protein n=1 Tax=Nocardia sp. NPDC005366 TaxID=3156878 RepID=UPI00339E405E